MVIIGLFYLLMARILIQSSHKVIEDKMKLGYIGVFCVKIPCEKDAASRQYGQNKQIEARKKVAKVVLSFVIVFIACWLPRLVNFYAHHKLFLTLSFGIALFVTGIFTFFGGTLTLETTTCFGTYLR